MKSLRMLSSVVFSLMIILLSSSLARTFDGKTVISDPDVVYQGAVIGLDKSLTDSLQVYGGPMTVEGRFQAPLDPNLPDWQGWTSADATVDTVIDWRVDVYNAANLDPATPGNHAWWCGDDIPSCGESDPAGGYDNGWNEYLDWKRAAPDTTEDLTVRVEAVLNYDTEPTYDFLYLEYVDGYNHVTVLEFDGQAQGEIVEETFIVPAGGFDDGDVHLRWRFFSDGGASDADCMFMTAGAAQIDLITVSFYQDGDWIRFEEEDCEPGKSLQWTPTLEDGVGDFAKIWPVLDDIDPCNQNTTAQVAFVDDGLVVPGTGGTTNSTWTYGPDGYVVNNSGGLMGPGHHINNYIASPTIAWPAGYEGCVFACDIWNHLTLESGVFRYWDIRSTNDPAGLDGWSVWKSYDFIYYGIARYHRAIKDVTPLLLQNPTFVQVRMGVVELGWVWGIFDDTTPAPYFDNVSLTAYVVPGPWITARELDLAQDNFPASGLIDPLDLSTASVRFDMAVNYDPGDQTRFARHDSICITTDMVREGAVYVGRPQMHYRLFANPLFDEARSSGFPLIGSVAGDSARVGTSPPLYERWAFDLPDSNFLFPGDVLHYYFTATDDVSGDTRTAMLPADTTGFSVPPDAPDHEPLLYPEAFTMRALPTIISLDPLEQRPALLVDDSGSDLTRAHWVEGLQYAYPDRTLFDIYVTNSPGSNLNNGLGAHASTGLLAGYSTIIYAAGIQPGIQIDDHSGDARALLDWLDLGGAPQSLLISGNDVVHGMSGGPGSDELLLLDRLDVAYVDPSITGLIEDQASPRAVANVPGAPINGSMWLIDTECPEYATHNATTAVAPGMRLAEYMDLSGHVGAYPYSALTQTYSGGDLLLTMPFDIRFAVDLVPVGKSASEILTAKLLQILGYSDTYGDSAGPALAFKASAAPNPFNPITRIAYTAPARGRLMIDVFNVRGEKVRALHDAIVQAGPGQVEWDGRNDRGAEMASGVYFCRVKTGQDEAVLKVALVR